MIDRTSWTSRQLVKVKLLAEIGRASLPHELDDEDLVTFLRSRISARFSKPPLDTLVGQVLQLYDEVIEED